MTKLAQQLRAAEIKLYALDAGLVDLDTLKVIDTSTITMNDEGRLQGHKEAFEAARNAKPHLFKQDDAGDAMKMSSEAYQKAKYHLTGRHR